MKSRKRVGVVIASLVFVLSLGGLVWGGHFYYQEQQAIASAPKDMDGNPVKQEEGDPVRTPEEIKLMDVVEPGEEAAASTDDGQETSDQASGVASPEQSSSSSAASSERREGSSKASGKGKTTSDIRLRVPSVGLNVGVGSMNMVHGDITPPGYAAVYRIRNMGSPEGRTFMAAHSVHAGTSPGNYLLKAHVGDSLFVGDQEYKITDTRHIDKGALSNDTETWKDEPNTLAIITCLQRERGKSLQNVVIIAQKV